MTVKEIFTGYGKMKYDFTYKDFIHCMYVKMYFHYNLFVAAIISNVLDNIKMCRDAVTLSILQIYFQ